MEEENEFTKLPIEERCIHKSWKARISGYEEAAKLFRQIDDEKSPEWGKYIPLVKKFVIDTNAPAQEKGLEAVLAFVENCGSAGKTVADVMIGLVHKCIAAPKAKTKDVAMQICMMYIEIEKQEIVVDELIKGLENKNPKIVAASLTILTQALKFFGPKIVNVNKIMKRLPSLLEDRDKAVRTEGRSLAVEMFKWMGNPIRTLISSVKHNQQGDVEAEFEKVKDLHPKPTRLIRSQQTKKQQPHEERRLDIEDGVDGEEDTNGEADPYDLLEPVDILSKLPKDFYSQLEVKKWSDRKEALETLEKILGNAPKIENGDYGDLIRALKKIIVKDSNVIVVQVGIKCITGLANGLKKKFHVYAGVLIPSLLEKFKEKKQNIVVALREAVDAIYPSTSLDQLLEDILIALDNKNPAMKAETVSFLARCFSKSTPAILTKKLLKALSPAILKALNESDPVVRENAAVALGTAMKVVGEKGIAPYLGDIDNVKMIKVKECCEKAELVVKQLKRQPSLPIQSSTLVIKSAVKTKKAVDKAKKSSEAAQKKDNVTGFDMDEVLQKARALLPAEVLHGLQSTEPTLRLTGYKQLEALARGYEKKPETGLTLLAVLRGDKPRLDTNLTCESICLDAIKRILLIYPLHSYDLDFLLNPIFECLLESETYELTNDCLNALIRLKSLDYIIHGLLESDTVKRNPRLWSEALNWISNTVIRSGPATSTTFLMEEARRALGQSDLQVRNAALALIGTLHIHPTEELQLSIQRSMETCKMLEREGSSHVRRSDYVDERSDLDEPSKGTTEETAKRTDLTPEITEQLLTEMNDKSWKVRAEALNKLITLVKDSGKIGPELGDLPPVLAVRINDSNIKISVSAVAVVEALINAMGPPIKYYTRIFLPALFRAIGDSKPWVRAAVVNCVNTLASIAGHKEFFEGEIFAEAFRSGTSTVRIELWTWLAERLPNLKNISKDELSACLPTLFANLEDRSLEVRKAAGEAVLGFMIHLGYAAMILQAENVRNGGALLRSALEKARASLPEKPIVKTKSERVVRPMKIHPGTSSISTTSIKTARAKAMMKTVQPRKKEEDVDTGPLLQVNNLKHQRVIDEQKMKTLRWNFASPRPEFIELLRDQMIAANLNKTLIANMFNIDFRYHLRAIEALTEDLPANRRALMCNLDLILRWMTIRFFDTNPSVLLKGLEYLNSVFDALIEEGYNMLDNEAFSFFPYLILKVGDPKDAVRNSVRSLFKQIAAIYPVGKQFSFVIDGLKSKNARQRSECLDQLGWLIENYGVSVCHPSPATSLKEIAKYIADRDTTVRNSALNCVVTAYFLEGDKILKMVGQISEKDMSLLEERIKRAAKNRPVASVKPMRASPPPTSPSPQLEQSPEMALTEMQRRSPSPQISGREDSASSRPVETRGVKHPAISKDEERSQLISSGGPGPYGLDPNVLDEIENAPVQFQAPKLVDIDLQFLKDPATQATVNPIQMAKVTPSLSKFTQPAAIKWELNQISSNDIEKAMAAMTQVDTILNSDKRNLLMGFVDHMVNQLVVQLMTLNQCTHPDLVNCYRANFSLLMKLCNYQELCHNVSEDTLYCVLEQLLLLLTEHRFERIDRHEMFIRVVNSLVIRLLETTNKTNILCALVKMLYSSVKSTHTTRHYQELVIKCLWKLNRTQPDWDSELNYVRILTEIHCFMRDYPTAWWKNQLDVPLRTIKTMLHSMVKLRGAEVKEHLKNVHGLTPDSEMYNYVRKVIKHLKVDNVPGGAVGRTDSETGQYRLSKETHDELSEIFRMIGDVDETSEGIRRLFEFKKAHPEADVDPFLSKATPIFQQYIKKGLASLEGQPADTASSKKITKESSGTATGHGHPVESEPPSTEDPGAQKRVLTKEAERLWNRLQLLQEQAGCQSEKKTEKIQENVQEKEEDNNFCNGSHRAEQEELNTQFESIKQRLEHIKSTYKNN